jgi:hypothetical protein
MALRAGIYGMNFTDMPELEWRNEAVKSRVAKGGCAPFCSELSNPWGVGLNPSRLINNFRLTKIKSCCIV